MFAALLVFVACLPFSARFCFELVRPVTLVACVLVIDSLFIFGPFFRG